MLSQTDGEPFEVPTVQRLRRQRISSAGVPQLLTGDDPTDAYDDVVKLIKDAGYSFELAPAGQPLPGRRQRCHRRRRRACWSRSATT